MDKRRNKKGKWEYLIRWKGYGSKEDTWEPEQHLLHCEEFIHQFNRLHAHKPAKPPKMISNHPSAAECSRTRPDAQRKRSICGPAVGVKVGATLGVGSGGSGVTQKQRKVGVGGSKNALDDRMSKAMTYRDPPPGGPHRVPPVREPHNGLLNGEVEPLVSHRLSSDRVDEEHKDMDGQQYTGGSGKVLKLLNPIM